MSVVTHPNPPGPTNNPNNPIPVIRNVIRDDELSKFKDSSQVLLPPLSPSKTTHLTKILKLLTDKHSSHMVERHCKVINKLTSVYAHGVHLKDVKLVMELLRQCHQKVHLDTTYEELVCVLVKLVGQPFLKSKVSDEQAFLAGISESFTELGAIAEHSSDKVKVELADTLAVLYMADAGGQKFSDCKPVSKLFVKSIIEKSHICKSLAECLKQVSDSEHRYTVMKSLHRLSDSSANCNDMLSADVASCICINLQEDMKVYKLLFVGLVTLWNILDHGNSALLTPQLTSLDCLNSLQEVFVNAMASFTSFADRQLRNDVILIIGVIASRYPMVPFVETGFVRTLSKYIVHPELPTNDKAINRIKLTAAPEDFEMKKLFLNLVGVLCNNPLAVLVMCKHHVMEALFSYVTPITQNNDTHWSLSQFEELQLQSLAVLSTFCPLSVDQYTTCFGNSRMLAFLDWCASTDQFCGHGNSFYGNGGQGNKRAQMRFCIRVVRNICATGDEEVCQDLADQGLINQLVAILYSCSTTLNSNDVIDVEIQSAMLFILASLCEGHVDRKALFGTEGVRMTVQYLQGYIGAMQDLLLQHRLVLSTLDCVCAVVIGYHGNEIDFLEREGAFLLLDLLEVCPDNMKNIVLVLLSDLLENEKTTLHLTTWRGNQEKTVAKLLVDIWNTEEKNLGVCRETHGVISDVTRPLMTSHQDAAGYRVLPTSHFTTAIVDVYDNVRSKVYGIFCKIGFTDIVGLDSADFIVLSIIEKYLDFKALEVWQEVRAELELEHVEPVEFDKEGLEQIIFILQSKALTVTVVQKALINNNVDISIVEEKDFFERIKQTYKQDEKVYQDFSNYINRTSDHGLLKLAKDEQVGKIERSRVVVPKPPAKEGKVLVHPTVERSLRTTTFCGRHLKVESTNFRMNAVTTGKT